MATQPVATAASVLAAVQQLEDRDVSSSSEKAGVNGRELIPVLVDALSLSCGADPADADGTPRLTRNQKLRVLDVLCQLREVIPAAHMVGIMTTVRTIWQGDDRMLAASATRLAAALCARHSADCTAVFHSAAPLHAIEATRRAEFAAMLLKVHTDADVSTHCLSTLRQCWQQDTRNSLCNYYCVVATKRLVKRLGGCGAFFKAVDLAEATALVRRMASCTHQDCSPLVRYKALRGLYSLAKDWQHERCDTMVDDLLLNECWIALQHSRDCLAHALSSTSFAVQEKSEDGLLIHGLGESKSAECIAGLAALSRTSIALFMQVCMHTLRCCATASWSTAATADVISTVSSLLDVNSAGRLVFAASGHDSSLVDLLQTTLDLHIAFTQAGRLDALGTEARQRFTMYCCPPRMLHCALQAMMFDTSVLLDFTTSGETEFLAYLVQVLKFFDTHFAVCAQELQNTPTTSEGHDSALVAVMFMLRGLKDRLGRASSARLLQFSVTPLIRRLASLLDKHEAHAVL